MKGKYYKKKRNPVMTALIVALSAVLLVLILGIVYLTILMDQVTYDPGQDTLSASEVEELLNQRPEDTLDPTAETVNPEDMTWETGPAEEIGSGDVLTILLIGQDRRPGEVRARSDVMILCTVNPNTKELTLTSLMRDMYVPIPGYMANRINVPYLLGGMDLLKKCIKQNFGITVDGCVEVDFNGFMDVVELMGGIDVALTAQEANHLNSHEAHYDFPEENWNLQEGMNHLNAKQALAYSRVRNIGNSDFDRTGRQRKVISAMLGKIKTMSVGKINELLMTGAGLVTTDMSRAELLDSAMSLLPILGDLKLSSLQIPAEGTYQDQSVSGVGRVLVPDLEANRKLLEELYK